MASLTMKQGEAKTITFTVTDSASAAVDCSSTTCTFTVVNDYGGTPFITKADGVFDKTNAATGILTIDISATDSNIPNKYYIGELKIVFTSSNIDKSVDIDFIITKTVE